MKRAMLAWGAGAIALSLGACTTPAERAAGGAAIGSLTGAAVGAAATGRAGGALAGAAAGAASGAVVGAATAPPPPVTAAQCPYGTYSDAAGNLYCR